MSAPINSLRLQIKKKMKRGGKKVDGVMGGNLCSLEVFCELISKTVLSSSIDFKEDVEK